MVGSKAKGRVVDPLIQSPQQQTPSTREKNRSGLGRVGNMKYDMESTPLPSLHLSSGAIRSSNGLCTERLRSQRRQWGGALARRVRLVDIILNLSCRISSPLRAGCQLNSAHNRIAKETTPKMTLRTVCTRAGSRERSVWPTGAPGTTKFQATIKVTARSRLKFAYLEFKHDKKNPTARNQSQMSCPFWNSF